MDWTRDGYMITDERERVDLAAVERFLHASYWASDRTADVIERSLDASVTFAVLRDSRQVGMARVVTDGVTFAWLCDVFIDPEHRGRGLGKWLISVVVGHPQLASVRTWMLSSRDAHGLYAQFGFTALPHPERVMIRREGPPIP